VEDATLIGTAVAGSARVRTGDPIANLTILDAPDGSKLSIPSTPRGMRPAILVSRHGRRRRLIRLMTSQNADALKLASDQIPKLLRGGLTVPLSMPPVPAPMIETFVREVLPGDRVGAMGDGTRSRRATATPTCS